MDLAGLKCPLPALRTRKALEQLPSGVRLVVICTDPMAVIDIPHVAQESGAVLEERVVDEGRLTFTLRKRD
nr:MULTISPECIES: sulfurtransferase TusA family protein [unclassified Xanthobacter]